MRREGYYEVALDGIQRGFSDITWLALHRCFEVAIDVGSLTIREILDPYSRTLEIESNKSNES